MEDLTEDAKVFGPDAWVYCESHLSPHGTGWCTVPARDKTKLDAITREDAYAECRAKGLYLYGEKTHG